MGEAMEDVVDYSLFAEEPSFHFTCPYWTWGDEQAAALAHHVSPQDKIRLFQVEGESLCEWVGVWVCDGVCG